MDVEGLKVVESEEFRFGHVAFEVFVGHLWNLIVFLHSNFSDWVHGHSE